MDKVQKTNFTDYNAPSSEPFRLPGMTCSACITETYTKIKERGSENTVLD
jgi:hypothetical protein